MPNSPTRGPARWAHDRLINSSSDSRFQATTVEVTTAFCRTDRGATLLVQCGDAVPRRTAYSGSPIWSRDAAANLWMPSYGECEALRTTEWSGLVRSVRSVGWIPSTNSAGPVQ